MKIEPRFAWTDEAIATVKTMYAKGASDTQIGVAIGTGRLSVLGKRHRLGLVRTSAQLAISKATNTKRPAPPPRLAKSQAPTKPPAELAAPPSDAPAKPPYRPKAHASTAPEKACSLLQLDSFRSCKWPISPAHVRGADMLFCGAAREEGSSYCPIHREASGARPRSEAERERDAKAVAAMAAARRRRAA